MTDNAHELSMGEIRRFCEAEGIKLSTTVLYHPASNGIAKRTIGVLTSPVRDACGLRFAKVPCARRLLTWQLNAYQCAGRSYALRYGLRRQAQPRRLARIRRSGAIHCEQGGCKHGVIAVKTGLTCRKPGLERSGHKMWDARARRRAGSNLHLISEPRKNMSCVPNQKDLHLQSRPAYEPRYMM